MVRGESIGIVELSAARAGAFTDREIELAQLLTREAAVTFERKTSATGQLFGSVTSADIAHELETQGYTVVSQTTASTTPTVTGVAMKLDAANNNTPIALGTGDSFTVALKSADGTTTLGTYSYTVGGSSNPSALSYNTTTGGWTLNVPAAPGLSAPTGSTPKVYNVDVSTTTTANVTRSDISSSELTIVAPPSVTAIDEAWTAGPGTNTILNVKEASDGTVVRVSLAGTGWASWIAMMIFLGVLTIGFAYEWKKGALEWI